MVTLITIVVIFLWLVIMGSLALLPYLIILGVKWLAKRDKIWTILEENTAKIVLSSGEVSHVLFASREYELKGWEVEAREKTSKSTLIGGIRFIGIPGIHEVDKTFNIKPTIVGENKTCTEDEWGSGVIRLQKILHYIKVTKADTSDRIPVDMVIFVNARVSNVYKAVYGVQKFTSNLQATVHGGVVDLTRKFGYSQLVSGVPGPMPVSLADTNKAEETERRTKDTANLKEELSDMIRAQLEDEVVLLKDTAGVEIDLKSIAVESVNASDPEFEKTAGAEVENAYKAKGVIAESVGAMTAARNRVMGAFPGTEEKEMTPALALQGRALDVLEKLGGEGRLTLFHPSGGSGGIQTALLQEIASLTKRGAKPQPEPEPKKETK